MSGSPARLLALLLTVTLPLLALSSAGTTPTATAATAPAATSATSAAADRPCGGRPPVVLLHDLGAGTASLGPLRTALRRDGRCVRVLPFGTPRLLAGTPLAAPSRLGGLDSLDAATTEIGADLARIAGGGRTVDVVGVGAGSLVAVRYLQTAAHPVRIRTLVAVGALWRGTDLAGLGTLEQLSRDAGTYDLVLGLEKLALDPLCASCREIVRGSDFLRALAADGVRRPGTRQVNILSRTDGLVVPWRSGRLAGTRTRVVQDVEPGRRVNHLQLAGDRVVISLVRAELAR